MGCCGSTCVREIAELHGQGVRLRVIGDRIGWRNDIVSADRGRRGALTADNDRMRLVIALSYGARQEIAGAARPWPAGRGRASLRRKTSTRRRLGVPADRGHSRIPIF